MLNVSSYQVDNFKSCFVVSCFCLLNECLQNSEDNTDQKMIARSRDCVHITLQQSAKNTKDCCFFLVPSQINPTVLSLDPHSHVMSLRLVVTPNQRKLSDKPGRERR
jgi:hypothetical protein